MKTYLMALLTVAMMLSGLSTWAASEEESSHSTPTSATSRLDVEELKPAIEDVPAEKPIKHYKRATSNKQRAKDLDFRHCLELEDNAAIAQCAQEQ